MPGPIARWKSWLLMWRSSSNRSTIPIRLHSALNYQSPVEFEAQCEVPDRPAGWLPASESFPRHREISPMFSIKRNQTGTDEHPPATHRNESARYSWWVALQQSPPPLPPLDQFCHTNPTPTSNLQRTANCRLHNCLTKGALHFKWHKNRQHLARSDNGCIFPTGFTGRRRARDTDKL